MIHKNCGGTIVLDLSEMYLINSPSINISPKGITPGMIQIDSNPEKKHSRLMCNKCGETLSSQEEFEDEITELCGICAKYFAPSLIFVTDFFKICKSCLNYEYSDSATSKRIGKDATYYKILSLYGEAIHKADNPTLLTILMKK
jgi:hypothetical protein